ncbi:hypothetical protein C0J52_36908 [Blattella germanica]|nr:hypothetical protein C0J52_36908 [Blattella germanica]
MSTIFNLTEILPILGSKFLFIIWDKIELQPMQKILKDTKTALVTNATDAFEMDFPSLQFKKIYYKGREHRKLSNYLGRFVRGITFHCPPLVFATKETRRNSSYIGRRVQRGVEMSIFLEIARRLNFTWTLRVFPEYSLWWGHNNNTDFRGVDVMLATGQADVAFGSLWTSSEHQDSVDFSVPWTLQTTSFLVPRSSTLILGIKRLSTPFQTTVWMLIFLCIAIVLFFISIFFRGFEKIQQNQIYHRWLLNDVILTLVAGTSPNTSMRILLWHWQMFCTIMIAGYCSNLVAHLSSPFYNHPLDSIEDLVNAGLSWGYDFPLPEEQLFDLQNRWHVQFIARFEVETEQSQANDRVKSKTYAVLARKLEDSNYIIGAEELDATSLHSLHLMKEYLIRRYLCFGFNKHSPYKYHFDDILKRLISSGIIIYWQRHTKTTSVFSEAEYSIRTSFPKPLLLENLQGAFFILMLGHLIALITFLIENIFIVVRICNTKI